MEAFVYEQAIDKETYDTERARLQHRLALAQTDLQKAISNHAEFECAMAFARDVSLNARRFWDETPGDLIPSFLRTVFPEGLQVRNRRISNPTRVNLFSNLQQIPAPMARVASPTGFEPVSPA